MFHTTELKSRYNHQIVFIERIGDSGIVLEPFQRSENLIEISSLKAGCLLAGIGLGLLVGFIINMCMATNSYYDDGWYRHEVAGTAYGASVLLFGGIGLIIAFVIELKLGKGNK